MESKKILEIAGESWMSGIALQPYIGVGGLFSEATNFDPFERLGVYKTSLVERQWGASTVTVAGLFNVGATIGGLPYFYSFGSGATYRIKTADTVTNVLDVTSYITGITTIRGAGIYKDRIIYANDSTVKARPQDVTSGSEVTLLSTLSTANHIMKVGADGNLYITNKQYIAMVSNIAATTDNYAQQVVFDDDVVTRDLESDGKYLVIAADNNAVLPTGSTGTHKCFVAFWNMKSGEYAQKWEFADFQIYAIKKIENDILIFCRNGIYICNVNSPPQLLMSLRGNANITASLTTYGNPGAVVSVNNNVVMWGAGGTVYAYGRPHPSLKRIFYKPYSLASGSNIYSLFHDGNLVYAMDTIPKLWDFGGGSTRQISTLTLSDVDFKTKYKLAFVKVVLRSALASGQSVDVEIKTEADNRTVLDTSGTQWGYASDKANASHIFYPNAISGSTNVAGLFEDLTNIEITNNKAEIRRVEIWANPVDPAQNSGY